MDILVHENKKFDSFPTRWNIVSRLLLQYKEKKKVLYKYLTQLSSGD